MKGLTNRGTLILLGDGQIILTTNEEVSVDQAEFILKLLKQIREEKKDLLLNGFDIIDARPLSERTTP